MKTLMIIASVMITTHAIAQETVWLNVNQTHTLAWQWEQTEGPVRSFVFKCGQYVKEIVDADARSLRFGSLIDEPGAYTGCTIAAKNQAGLSAPVALPSFNYAYSYWGLGRLVLELAASFGAATGVLTVSVRHLLGWVKRRQQQSTPLALPEPIIIMENARDHVRHSYW